MHDGGASRFRPVSLNDCLAKFVMEVDKESGKRHPPSTVYGIECGLKRHFEDKND